jgi:hypothetical protein
MYQWYRHRADAYGWTISNPFAKRSVRKAKSSRETHLLRFSSAKSNTRCCRLRLSHGPFRFREKQRNARMKEIFTRVRLLGRPAAALGLVLSILLLGGCGPAAVKPASLEQANAISARATGAEYRLQPGDELDIRFYYNPELNSSGL